MIVFPNQRVLVAVRELGAVQAVAPDFVGQVLLVGVHETQRAEKGGLIGEGEDPADFPKPRLVQAGLDQPAAEALPLPGLGHRERADFRQVQ